MLEDVCACSARLLPRFLETSDEEGVTNLAATQHVRAGTYRFATAHTAITCSRMQLLVCVCESCERGVDSIDKGFSRFFGESLACLITRRSLVRVQPPLVDFKDILDVSRGYFCVYVVFGSGRTARFEPTTTEI